MVAKNSTYHKRNRKHNQLHNQYPFYSYTLTKSGIYIIITSDRTKVYVARIENKTIEI